MSKFIPFFCHKCGTEVENISEQGVEVRCPGCKWSPVSVEVLDWRGPEIIRNQSEYNLFVTALSSFS